MKSYPNKLFFAGIFMVLSINNSFAQQMVQGQLQDYHQILMSDFPGLLLRVFNKKTQEPRACRVVIQKPNGEIINSYYEHLPGIFTKEDGMLRIILDAGTYNISVFSGITYRSCSFDIEVGDDRGVEAEVYLKPWIPLKDRGWVDVAGHCHLYSENKPDPAMARMVRKICTAQGVEAVFTAQGWSGYNDQSWENGFGSVSDDKFRLYFSSEMPKYRTGHTWWLGQKSTYGYYHATMDTVHENQYYQVARDEIWNFEEWEFPNVPDLEVVQRLKKLDGGLAVMAHPTSWWWQERGDIVKYTTNVPAYLSYGLLAGRIWDATVIMGYNHDHYFYQNLWFNILNEDYQMTGLAELDGGITRSTRFYYGSMRTYVHTKGSLEEKDIIKSVKEGKVVVSSGPMVFLNHKDSSAIGSSFMSDGTKRVFHLEAYASGESGENLSYIVLYRNGLVHQLWDLREERPRHFSDSIEISESKKAWYVVKAYGRDSWDDPKYLDIMKYCSDSLISQLPPSSSAEFNVCITNPIYFRPEIKEGVVPLTAEVELRLLDPGSGEPINSARIYILENGKSTREISFINAKTNFELPLKASILIQAEGYPEIRRSLYLDYPPHLELIEELGNGNWHKEDNCEVFSSGQLPWRAFNYQETKALLSKVKWDITLEENVRDKNWKAFDAKFKLE